MDIQHHENGKSMLEAAKYCHVCFAITYRMGDLWEAAKLPLKWTVRIHPNNQKSLDSASSTFTAPFAYGITVDFSPDDMIQGSGNLFAMRSQRGQPAYTLRTHPANTAYSDSGGHFTRNEVGAWTGSELSLNVARSWIETCSRTHVSCGSDRPAKFLPTRLLDLRSLGEAYVRVVEKGEVARGAKYMTLSHCWGRRLVASLKKANMESMKTGLTLKSLSRTYQHAIYVARKLGIFYLWIDSLCIIQDSPEDWRQESINMCRVYGSSFCNIAATASADGDEGCFRDRDKRILDVCTINIPYGSHTEPFYFVEQQPPFEEIFERAPLLKRAWVVQERVLSPRVLHFDRHQLFWECNELTAWEESPSGIHAFRRLFPELPKVDLPSPVRINPEVICPNDAGINIDGFFSMWDEIATAYAQGALSNDSDRIVAFSGITSHLRDIVNDTCLSGIWTRSIERQLTWHFDSPCPKPNVQIAPTWSWLSAYGNFFKTNYCVGIYMFLFIKVLNEHDLVSRYSISGELDDPRMQVQGLLCPIQSCEDDIWGPQRHCIKMYISLRLDSSKEIVFGSYGTITPNSVISRNDWDGKMYWFLPVRLIPNANRLQLSRYKM